MRLVKLIAAVAVCLGTSVSFGQEEKTLHDEMMKKMQEAGTPGPEHKILETAAGEWSLSGKNWHGPKSKTSEWKGTASMQMVLGGRFLHQQVKGEMMGMQYEGAGTTGYNNIEKRYESTWMDNMSTSGMRSMGQWDPKTKTITEKGEHSCPFTANKVCTTRSEWKMVNKDKMMFLLYGPDQSGKEYKMMELTYARAK